MTRATPEWIGPCDETPAPQRVDARIVMPRGKVYGEIARRLGVREYHTAELKTVEDARQAYRAVMEIRRSKGMP